MPKALQIVPATQSRLRLVEPAAPQRSTINPAQRRQRELAWVLYITEGFIANVEHAERVNIVHLDGKDRATLRAMKKEAETSAALIRKRMNVQVFG